MTAEERIEHERHLARKRNVKYRAAHPERVRAANKARKDATREQRLSYNAAYRATHREEAKAYRASLDAAKVRAYNKGYYAATRTERVACNKAWYAANRERQLALAKAYYADHKDKWREYAELNKEEIAKKNAARKRANRAYYTAQQRKRDALKRNAMPPWANAVAIEAFYQEAARLSRETGIQYDVDHICPLQGKTVCGLHVAHNLQVLTHAENMRKRNKLLPIAWAA